jgi:hypothetical protein
MSRDTSHIIHDDNVVSFHFWEPRKSTSWLYRLVLRLRRQRWAHVAVGLPFHGARFYINHTPTSRKITPIPPSRWPFPPDESIEIPISGNPRDINEGVAFIFELGADEKFSWRKNSCIRCPRVALWMCGSMRWPQSVEALREAVRELE